MRKSKSFDSLYILHAFEGEKKQKNRLNVFPSLKGVFFCRKKENCIYFLLYVIKDKEDTPASLCVCCFIFYKLYIFNFLLL